MNGNKKKGIIIVVLLIAIISLIFITSAKNCGTDDTCFNKASSRCALAKVTTFTNDNKYQYEIVGKKQDNCILDVTLLNLSTSQSQYLQNALNGKSMRCAIPLEILKEKQIKNIDNLNDYCTGELKESILQITIEKLYDLIVKNLGDVEALSDIPK